MLTDRHPVAAALGRQIEVDDLRKLLLQDRHEDLVEGHAEDGRLVGRLAGVGRVVDRVAPMGHAARSRTPGTSPARCSSRCGRRTGPRAHAGSRRSPSAARRLARPEKPARPGGCDLRARTRPSPAPAASARVADAAVGHLGSAAAQQPGELVFGERVRDRRDGAEHRRRIGAEGDRERKRPAGPAGANSRKSSAPPRWASQRMITLAATDHLLAVDAEVLALARPGSPCGPRVMTRPQVINGPASSGQQVWIGSAPRSTSSPSQTTSRQGGRAPLRPHVPDRSRHLQQRPASRRPFGGSGSFRLASTTPMSRSRSPRWRPSPRRPDVWCRRDSRDRNPVTVRPFEDYCRAAPTKGEVTDRCHLKPRGDWLRTRSRSSDCSRTLRNWRKSEYFIRNRYESRPEQG